MSSGRERISDWALERLAAGDLDDAAAATLRARVAADSEAQARLRALEQSNKELLAAHPPSAVAQEVERRRHRRAVAGGEARRRSPRRWFLMLAPLVAAAAVLVLVARPQPVAPGADVGDGDGRIKGLKPSLHVYRRTGDQAQTLRDGAPVRAHDTLQVAYLSAGRSFGAVLSVDGHGVVTWHLPEQAGAAVPLAPHDEIRLPHSFELDAAPGFERFVFVTADHPFDARQLARTLEAAQPLPAGFEQTTVTLKKETP